ncbi:hypothetical protein [Leptospira santarosai]|nr:hypothetical protein LEP1GSC048_2443 [Leptospira santarosai serovar Shermani str. 1342KT]
MEQKNQNLHNTLGYFYVPEEFASKKCKGLFSDCNEEGNSSLFDCLFSDVNQHQVGIERFLDPCKKLKDSTGAGIDWHEYYDLNGNLLYRQEYRLLKSGDVLSVGNVYRMNFSSYDRPQTAISCGNSILRSLSLGFIEMPSNYGSSEPY